MPSSPSPDRVLARSGRVSWRVLEGDAVILYPEAGTLHRLNGTGTRLWELLDGERSLHVIAETLMSEYDVALDQAVAELADVAGDLVTAGLAEVCA